MTRIKNTYLAALAVLLSPMAANADPISFTFNIQASEGSVSGEFTGNDADTNGNLDATEILSFMATATGTAFTGGPFTIDATEAIINSFAFNIAGLALSAFDVTNGLPNFATGSEWIVLESETLRVGLNNRESTRLLVSTTVSRVSSVPEPGTLALLGLGLAGIGFAKRKKV
jgi:hypothetical protein